jgi:hypothetical protein
MLSTDQRNLCLELYRVSASDFINALTSKDLYASLKAVNQYRNDWKGHGGVASEKEQLRRLDLLQRELTRVREIFTDSFEQSELIAPGKSEYAQGIFHYTANSLRGSRIALTL